MSGHSKWSTIKRKKGVADAKRGADGDRDRRHPGDHRTGQAHQQQVGAEALHAGAGRGRRHQDMASL